MIQPWRSKGVQGHISSASQLWQTSTVHTIDIKASIPHSPSNFQRPSQYFSFFLSSSFFLLCLRWILFTLLHQRKEILLKRWESHILASFYNLDLNSNSYHINVEEGRGESTYIFWDLKMCQLINVIFFYLKFKITLISSCLPFYFSSFFLVVKTKTINLCNLLKVTYHMWHNLFFELRSVWLQSQETFNN